MLDDRIKEYWGRTTPMQFADKKGYRWRRKRAFRYKVVPYMLGAFRFHEWKDKQVLEIGCGAGIDAVEFASHGANVSAVDISAQAVEATKGLAKEAERALHRKVDVNVTQYDGTRLPFGNRAFDCVYSCGVLHHIPHLNAMLAEIRRVLKDDGTLLAMVYNRYSLAWAFTKMYLGGETERIPGVPFVYPMSKEEAEQMFGRYFKQVEVTTHYNVIDLPGERKVKFHIKGHGELGWHLVIRASGRKD